MRKVRVAELKSRLSESKGSPLVVRPRSARAVRPAAIPLPPPLKLKTDIVALLAQERGER